MISFRLLVILLATHSLVMSSELSDFHNGTVDEASKSDASDTAISIDDSMMKLNGSAVEPDAEIIMTNGTGAKNIKRKSEFGWIGWIMTLSFGRMW
jgi:hypothetical protein